MCASSRKSANHERAKIAWYARVIMSNVKFQLYGRITVCPCFGYRLTSSCNEKQSWELLLLVLLLRSLRFWRLGSPLSNRLLCRGLSLQPISPSVLRRPPTRCLPRRGWAGRKPNCDCNFSMRREILKRIVLGEVHRCSEHYIFLVYATAADNILLKFDYDMKMFSSRV